MKTRGLEDLDFCALGPEQYFFARWKSGGDVCHQWAEADLTKALRDWGKYIDTMSFGYGEAWIMTDWQELGDMKKYVQTYQPSTTERIRLVRHRDFEFVARCKLTCIYDRRWTLHWPSSTFMV